MDDAPETGFASLILPLGLSLVELVPVSVVSGRDGALPRVLHDVDLLGTDVGRAAHEFAVHGGDRQVAPRLLDAGGAREQAVLDLGVVGRRQLAVALGELAAHQHVLQVARVRVQHERGDGVDPAEQRGRAAVVDEHVGDGARRDDADVVAAQRLAAGARRHQEGLVHRHGVVGRDGALLQHVEVQRVARVLQPDARLRRHVGRVGEEGVDAQRHLVLHAVADAGLVRVAVVHLGLGRVGDVLVARVQQLGVALRHEGAVREDDGDRVVEEPEVVQQLGAVVGRPRPAQVVRRHGRDVELARQRHDVARLLAVRVGVEGVVGHGGRDEGVPGGHVVQQAAEVGDLVGHAEAGDVVEGVGPEDAGAAVERGLQAGARRRVGPGVVGVVERRRGAGVEGLVEPGQLADVDVVGRQVVARHELAEAVEVLGERRVGRDGLEARLPAVAVRVDEAGRDDLARAVDDLGGVVVVAGGGHGGARLVDARDAVLFDQHGSVADHVEGLAGLIEGDDGAARQEDRRGLGGGHEGGEDSRGVHGGLLVLSRACLVSS